MPLPGKLRPIEIGSLEINPVTVFAKDWPLLTAGNEKTGYNTMTIAWGHIGAIWGKSGGIATPTVAVYVRPQRYTKGFMDSNEMFTVSVLPSTFKKELSYLGTASGRDEDKISKAGLTPVFHENATYFEEANLVLICRKIYNMPLTEECFIDKAIVERNYPERDFHTMYFGEIVGVLQA